MSPQDDSGAWPVVLVTGIMNLPSMPFDLASAPAASMAASDMPASSARLSTTSAAAFASLSTFWAKVVCKVASSPFKALSFSLSAAESWAPARTKSVW